MDPCYTAGLSKTVVVERHTHPKYPQLRIELRSDSSKYQAVTRLDNRLRQWTTGTDNLPTAIRLAEDRYRRELLERLPHIPKSGKIVANPRPWFSAAEWTRLCAVSQKRIRDARSVRIREDRQDLDDMMHFMVASMLRVNEAVQNIRFQDCRVEKNKDGEQMLIIELRRGKRGGRTVVATREAASIYQSRFKAAPEPTAFIFPTRRVDAFRELLEASGLRTNDEGFPRNLKSLRATSISARILDNPDLNPLFISRNAGVSLAVIDAFYVKRLTAEMKKHELSKVKPLRRDSAAALRNMRRQLRQEAKDRGDSWD